MSNPINVGLASFGMSGKVFHGPLLRANPNFKVTAVMQRTPRGADAYFTGCRIVKKFSGLTSDPEIELIIVNTPDHTHYEYVREAILAGKHVVVEKPFTIAVAEGQELIDLAKEKGVILSVFQNRRWDGGALTVKEILKKGQLGRIVEFESHYDRYRNYIQENTWKEDKKAGTGTLYNLGSHQIDEALFLFGLPESVWADLRIMRTGGKVVDYFNMMLRYKDKSVILRCSYLVKEEGPRIILHGTNGSYVKYGIDPQEERLKAGHLPDEPNWGYEDDIYWGTLNREKNGRTFRRKYKTVNGNYPAYYENIYKAIRRKKELAVKPEEALNVIRVIEAAIKSSAERREVPLS